MSKLALSPALIEGLGLTIVHSLWQATVLAGLLWVISRTIRSATWRYRLAYGTLLAQLAVSVGTFVYLYEPVRAVAASEPFSLAVFVSGAVPGAAAGAAAPTMLLPWVVMAWGLALCVGVVRLGWSFGRVRRMRGRVERAVDADFARRVRSLADRLGYTGKLNIALSRYVDGPALVGHLRPVLLFPVAMLNNLSTDEAEAVILHELAHLWRQDHWWNLLQCLVEVLFQYHPMVWWIGARIREEREHCCDDLVLSHGPGGLPYAKALLYFETQRSTPATAVALTNTPGGLLGRVQRFLHQQNIPYQMKSRLFLVPVLALVALIATAVSGPLSPTPPEEGSLTVVTLPPPPAPPTSTAPASAVPLPLMKASAAPTAVDTLPRGRHRVSSHSNNRSIDVTVDNRRIERLEIDGREIPEVEYPEHLQRVEDLLNGKTAGGDRWMTPEYDHGAGTTTYRFNDALFDGHFEGFEGTDGLEGHFEKLGEGWELRFEGMGEEFESLGERFEAMGERIGDSFETIFDFDGGRGVYRMEIGDDSDFFDHDLFSKGNIIHNGDTLRFEGGAGTNYPGLEDVEFDRIIMKMTADSLDPDKLEREELLREYEAMKAERDALLRERAEQRRLRGKARSQRGAMREQQGAVREQQLALRKKQLATARVREEALHHREETSAESARLRESSKRLSRMVEEDAAGIAEQALLVAEQARLIAGEKGEFQHSDIVQQLQDEGMLPNEDLKKLVLDNKSLSINGKKTSDSVHARYLEIYEEKNGRTLGDNFRVTVKQN